MERRTCSKSQKMAACLTGYILAHHHYKSSCRSYQICFITKNTKWNKLASIFGICRLLVDMKAPLPRFLSSPKLSFADLHQSRLKNMPDTNTKTEFKILSDTDTKLYFKISIKCCLIYISISSCRELLSEVTMQLKLPEKSIIEDSACRVRIILTC